MSRLNSTRLRIVAVAAIVAALREAAMQFGIELDDQTFWTVQAMLLGLMGMDTVRPLSQGYPQDDGDAS